MTGLGPPERAMMRRLLAVSADENGASQAHGVDWDLLASYAGVALSPLVLRGIDAGRAGGAVPQAIVSQLRDNQRLLATSYLKRHAALRTICGIFDGAAIPAIALKGAVVAHLAYPDPVLRPMVDLDLWLPRDRLDEAAALLEPHGFHYPAELAASTTAITPPERSFERKLRHDTTRVQVELHGEVRSLAGLAWGRFDRAWRAGERVALGGVEAQVQCPEHLLAHLSLHLTRNVAFATRLHHLLDVALVIERWKDRWRWPALVRDWADQRVTSWMLLGVVLARDLLGAPVPPDLERHAGPSEGWHAMLALSAERLWDADSHRLPPAVAGTLRTGTTTERLRWVRHRLIDYYWKSPADQGLLETALGSGRRIWHDLRYKLARYVRDWRSGALRGPALARSLELERSRAELERLAIEAGDLGYAGTAAHDRPRPG